MDDMDEVMAELVGNGFFELEMTPDGDVLYRMSENAQEINPAAHASFMESLTEELLEHVRAGFLEYRFNDDLDVEYRLTPEGIDYLKSIGALDPDFEPNYDD
jgi:hypothetical protein